MLLFHKDMSTAKIPSEKNFGLVMSGFFFILCLWPWIKGYGPPRYLWCIPSAFFFLSAFVLPKILKWPNFLWYKFGILLQIIMSPLILGAIFFGLFLPIGILLRLLKGDPLERGWQKEISTYWHNRPKDENPSTQLRQQF